MDYRFAVKCWQDQAGDENAKANIFVNGTQVATEVEVTATSYASPQLITWETTGLDAPSDGGSLTIKVVLANDYYVDASTDRNIHIDAIGYINKDSGDGNYKCYGVVDGGETIALSTITDFTNLENYLRVIPTAVTGDQIAPDFWSSRADPNGFYTISILGGDNGVEITIPTEVISYI